MNRYRSEEKYIITPYQYQIIKARVTKFLNLDTHAIDSDYLVTSIYFDDYLKTAVSEKSDGLKNRYKYRIRFYDDDKSFIQIEKKVKDNSHGFKQKLTISEEEYQNLMKKDFTFLNYKDNLFSKEMLLLMKLRKLEPMIEIKYKREAYNLPSNNIRITFDKDIKYRSIDEEDYTLISNNIILEIKYDLYLPSFIKLLLNDLSLTKASISKFLTCYLHKSGEEIIL